MATLYEQISNRRGGAKKKKSDDTAKNNDTIDLTVDTPSPQKKKQKNSSFPVGSNVTLQNLVKGQYNGKRGTIQTDEDISSGRQNVLLDGGNKVVSVKPENMKRIDSPQKKQKTRASGVDDQINTFRAAFKR